MEDDIGHHSAPGCGAFEVAYDDKEVDDWQEGYDKALEFVFPVKAVAEVVHNAEDGTCKINKQEEN